jgi:carnitine 3-dehydrogenase / betainyl-CoA thioesterase
MIFGVIGTGVIGAGWALRALSRGWEVVGYDPAPGAEARLHEMIERAWPSVRRIGVYPGADPGRIRFAPSSEEVADQAIFVQESTPENLDFKRQVLARLDGVAAPEVVIASSTSGLLPTDLQDGLRHPDRLVVGHPFNPVYLLPLVEVVGGKQTSPEAINRAVEVYTDLDMHPLVVRHEIDGFLSDRLLEALWREILHLVADGVATTGELDEAITYGPGLRWSGMGTNLIYHLAGGEKGMRHMLDQFGPALEWPWTKLVAPPLTEQLIERMVEGTSNQAAGRTVSDLERLRDDYLIAVMYALRESRLGAGEIIARREERILDLTAPERWSPNSTVPAPLALYQCRVVPEWTDYNHHMTESAYLLAFGSASDALFRYVGIDDSYRAAGHSFYTVETHLGYERQASMGALLGFSIQVLGVDEKRLHIFGVMTDRDTDDVLCTIEQMLVHVDITSGRSSSILAHPLTALTAIHQSHRALPPPHEAILSMAKA